ncbi:MAG TPA: hypothetical protein DCL29_04330 [Eubacterium sp.]|nr:hypothetical protein [Eubacterium sp.]
MKKKISTYALVALSTFTLFSYTPFINNMESSLSKTVYAEETKTDSTQTTTNSGETKKDIVISDEVQNSAKVDKIFENKIIISFKSAANANAYEVNYGNKKTLIKLNDSQITQVKAGTVITLTATLSFEKGTSIDDDIKIYPVFTDEKGEYKIDTNSKFITLGKEDIKLIPVAPSKVTISECYPTLKEVFLSWDRASYADGVQIKICNAKGKVIKTQKVKYKKATSKSSSLEIKKIDSTAFYKIKIRSYTTFNGKKVYGKWATKYITNALDTIATSDYKNGSIKLSWKKVKGATSYTIYASTKGTKNFKKIKTVKKKATSFQVKKIKKEALVNGKHYYFYVTADKKFKKEIFSSPLRYSAEAVFIK